MKLWLDDIRPAPEGWYWAKCGTEAIRCVRTGEVTHMSFDHDLGDGAMDGHDVICILEEMVAEGLVPIPEMDVHSDNPVGASRLRAAIGAIIRRVA